MRLLQLRYSQRCVAVRHGKGRMPHLSLDIQRATTHGKLCSRHVTTAVVSGNPLVIYADSFLQPLEAY